MSEKIDKRKNPTYLKPFQFKKGQSGNPNGRPKGKTLKEFTRELLMSLNDEEKRAFLNELIKRSPDVVWKMAEGNPHQDIDNTITVETPTPILDITAAMREIKGQDDTQPTLDEKKRVQAKNEPMRASENTPHTPLQDIK